MASWHIRGSYFESCNCDPICPCRRIDGVSGGRSTHGICTGVLSWLIDEGYVGEIDVTGLAAALALRYSDDEPGSPWSWILYLDDRGSPEQLKYLAGIFTGRLGGDAETHFPWVWKASEMLAVRRAPIEVDHTPRRQWLRVRNHVTVRIRDRFAGEATVTCVIPGHDHDGEELVTERLRVEDEGFAFEFSGVCGYASTFSYSSTSDRR
jgi:hypothetical protein